jgi:membrane protein YqaA with SNARE-associated domain
MPLVAVYIGVKQANLVPELIEKCEVFMLYALWWITLGILSSIGLGSGVQTGLIFLYPHILKVCLAAEKCGNVDFSILDDVFYSSKGFACNGSPSNTSEVSFLSLLFKVAPSSMLWGAGTAIGEIPPYWMAYCAIGNQESSEWSLLSPINRWQRWMVAFIEKRGFWGIFMLASWPNAAFDLCGMACGAFRMPFFTFFLGTLLGKGLVKVNIQNILFVSLFRHGTRDRILSFLDKMLPKTLPILSRYVKNPPSIELRLLVERSILRFKDSVGVQALQSLPSVQRIDVKQSLLYVLFLSLVDRFDTIGEWWTLMMVFFVGSFLISIVNSLANEEKRRCY